MVKSRDCKNPTQFYHQMVWGWEGGVCNIIMLILIILLKLACKYPIQHQLSHMRYSGTKNLSLSFSLNYNKLIVSCVQGKPGGPDQFI